MDKAMKARLKRQAQAHANTTSAQEHSCVNCGGTITAADSMKGDLVTVNVDGQSRAAHRVCPSPVAYIVAEARDPGIKAPPIALNPGDRIRIVFEGTVEDLEEGFVGPTPVVSNATATGTRLPHWLLRSSRVERLERVDPSDGSLPEANAASPIDRALVEYVTNRGIPMPFYTNGSKIIEEATELRDAVVSGDPGHVKEEVADVVITAAVAARQFGFTVEEALAFKIAKDAGRGPKAPGSVAATAVVP